MTGGSILFIIIMQRIRTQTCSTMYMRKEMKT